MKIVPQLNIDGYYLGPTVADESPLEPGVYLLPAGAIDAHLPETLEGKIARWADKWLYEDIPLPEPEPETPPEPELTYAQKRAAEYPPFADQFDLLYHGGYDAWKAAIQAVKDKYPKPET